MKNPKNHGKQWTAEHNRILGKLWNNNVSLELIATELERTCASICAQLSVLGFIYFSSKYDAYCYVKPNIWITLSDVRKIQKTREEL